MAGQSADSRLQFYLGPLVGVLIFLFSFTGVYERAELVTYDWRFNVRNTLFGPPPMHPPYHAYRTEGYLGYEGPQPPVRRGRTDDDMEVGPW